ncbi:MAG: response regulator transcription factor [Flavobacteriales bacterium]|nr:response regulator transcription factor [Flavobacteriales bacterium]
MFLRSRKRTRQPTAINDRDREYLRLLLTVPEPTPAQIADAMHRSVKTVEKRRYKVMRKLGAKTTLELYLAAVRRGLVECGCGKGKCGEGEEGVYSAAPK